MTDHSNCHNHIRIDQLLFYLRFYKSRNIAIKQIEKGVCKINENVIRKKNKLVHISDIIEIKNKFNFKLIKIISLPLKRGPYKEVIKYYTDITPDQKIVKNSQNNKISIGRRPTKFERRKLDKFIGRI